MNHFVECALSGAAPRMSFDDIQRARAVMAAAVESLRTGAAVPVGGGGAAAAGLVSAAAGKGAAWLGQVRRAKVLLQGSGAELG